MEIKSIMTDDFEHCYLCGRTEPQIHHIMNKYQKRKAEKWGLLIPLCYECHAMVHDKKDYMNRMRMEGQRKFEKIYSRDMWMYEFGKNYLWRGDE